MNLDTKNFFVKHTSNTMDFAELLSLTPHLPKYKQVASALRRSILNGTLAEGEKLPTEPELAKMFQINHLTLRKGLALLAEQNLISQTQGRGTFVTFRQKRHLRVGILVHKPVFHDVYLMRMILMLSNVVCSQGDYEIVHLPVDYIENLTKENLLNVVNNSKCDGIMVLVATPQLLDVISSPEFSHVNVVLCNIGQPHQTSNTCHVVEESDEVLTGVKYLYELGHRKIGFLGIASELYGFAKRRNEEFRRCLAEYGLSSQWMRLSPHRRLTIERDEWFDDCRLGVKELMTLPEKERPTALLASNHSCSLGMWQGAMDLGLKVPTDISLLGIDADLSYNPYFSAVAQPIEEIAKEAVKIMFSMDTPGKHLAECNHKFPAVIIERGSCLRLQDSIC